MYRWELDGPAQQEFADLPPAERVIPTRHCANLSAAVYTVLYDRHAKRVQDGLELRHSAAGDFDEPDHMADAVGVTWGG